MALSRKNLLNYLKDVCKLECSLYEINSLFNQLNNEVNNLRKWQPTAKYSYSDYSNVYVKPILSSKDCLLIIFIIVPVIFFGGGIIEAILRLLLRFFSPELKENPILTASIAVLIFIGTIVVKIYDLIRIPREKDRIRKNIMYENDMLKEENEKIDALNSNTEMEIYNKISLLENQIEILNEKYFETKDALDKLYSCDIIYSKYRNMPAVFAFYEFIYSKKCDSLEGHEGAYILYDELVFRNVVINKLDNIILNLNSIKQNQHTLYNAICSSNKVVEKIGSEIKYNLESIENNLEVSNYYNKINSRNLETIKNIQIYNSFIR